MQQVKHTSITCANLLKKKLQWAKMNIQQRKSFIEQVKKQASYGFLSAGKQIENKDYQSAKKTIISIAEMCFCIQNPDEEIRYLILICCHHLTLIYQIQKDTQPNKQSLQAKKRSKKYFSRDSTHVFIYNKFTGYFQCVDENKQNINKNVLFYVSKFNGILLNYQKEKKHSVLSMLQTYYLYFLMVLFLIVILVAMVFSGMISTTMNLPNGSIQSQLPIILCCSLFLYPLFKIYSKLPVRKDEIFFEQTLAEAISKINQLCLKKNQNIHFSMLEGTRIEACVGQNFYIKI